MDFNIWAPKRERAMTTLLDSGTSVCKPRVNDLDGQRQKKNLESPKRHMSETVGGNAALE